MYGPYWSDCNVTEAMIIQYQIFVSCRFMLLIQNNKKFHYEIKLDCTTNYNYQLYFFGLFPLFHSVYKLAVWKPYGFQPPIIVRMKWWKQISTLHTIYFSKIFVLMYASEKDFRCSRTFKQKQWELL